MKSTDRKISQEITCMQLVSIVEKQIFFDKYQVFEIQHS